MSFRDYSDVAAALAEESRVWSAGQGHTDEAVRNRALAAREWWANYQQPSPGGGGPPPPPPAPPPPPPPPPAAPTNAVKAAEPDVVLFDESSLPVELLEQILFQNIGGIELINISREDTINGQSVSYNLVRNLSVLNQSFNPNNLFGNQKYDAEYLRQFAIDISQRIPNPYETDDDGNKINPNPVVLDRNTGELVINIDINPDEYLSVAIISNGTIYTIGVS